MQAVSSLQVTYVGFKDSFVKDKCPGIVVGNMLSYKSESTIPGHANRSIITQCT